MHLSAHGVNWIPVISVLALSSMPLAAQESEIFSSQSPGQLQGDYFTYGMACAKLVELKYSEFLALVHSSHREFFNSFCLPEPVYTCSDYNGLLYRQGVLESGDGPLCQFVPASNS